MEVRRIAVIGAGTMGHGIAQIAAQSGHDTTLYDISPELVGRGMARIAANLDKGIERGKLQPQQREETLGRLRSTTELAEAAQADLVIEAAPEKLDLKRRIFAALDAAAPAACIFATNTSSLGVASICAELTRPDRFLGMHFFNPAYIMPLLEIVVHEGTAPETLAAARAVGEAMGKSVIVVKDSPGFATSRLGVLLGLEAMRMLEEGVASAEDIDTAMELGYRHPMGPLRLTDLVGLDVRLSIAEYLHEKLGSEAFRPPEILRRMVAEGKLGKKSGQGFYDWSGD